MRSKLNTELQVLQNQLNQLEDEREYNIDVIKEALKLPRNIFHAYKQAPFELKRQYLGLFWDKFMVADRTIVQAIPTKCVQLLIENKKVIIRDNSRRSPSLIITLKKLLADWRYLAKLREKLDEIKEYQRSLSSAA